MVTTVEPRSYRWRGRYWGSCPKGNARHDPGQGVRGTYYSKFGGLWIDDVNPKNVEDRIERIAVDAYLQEYERAADTPDLLIVDPGRTFSRERARMPGTKVLDTVMLLPTGPDLSFSPQIGRFLEEVFGDKALAFQSLHFEVGSTQEIHQDTAYVVVDHEPLKLIASWIALEDIEPGSGELIYYVGGHRIPEYIYADGASKHFDVVRDGPLFHAAGKFALV